MRKSRFTDEQMVTILREADRDPVAAVAKRHGVSEQTIYSWRKRFGTFQADDVRRLKQLEHENARLRKLVAERDLEIEVMKESTQKNGERAGSPWPGCLRDGPRPVATAGLHAGPSRTVCPAVSIAEGGQERGGDRTDAGAFGAVSALWLPARAHLSGSRRLRDEPWPGASVVACGKLQVPRKRPRKRIASSRPRPQTPVGPTRYGLSTSCSMLCGRPSARVPDGGGRIHEGRLGDRSRRSYPMGRVIEVLSRLVSERGAPSICAPTTARSSCRARCSNGSPIRASTRR